LVGGEVVEHGGAWCGADTACLMIYNFPFAWLAVGAFVSSARWPGDIVVCQALQRWRRKSFRSVIVFVISIVIIKVSENIGFHVYSSRSIGRTRG
jgi:hypothetical protein